MSTAEEIYRAGATMEEIEDVLSKRLNAAVGTLNGDGSIHLAFVIFLYAESRFYFETSSVTRKARNVRARPTASFEITPRPKWRSWCGEIFGAETTRAMGGSSTAVWLPDD
ncbi:MAG: pyridoxamine 5'-phosphate oxidase family protein [Acidimicrobiia bacterium]